MITVRAAASSRQSDGADNQKARLEKSTLVNFLRRLCTDFLETAARCRFVGIKNMLSKLCYVPLKRN